MRLLLMEGHGFARYGVDDEGNWWRSYFNTGGWQKTAAFRVPFRVREEFMSVVPSLEYLHGYTVKSVLIPEEGHEWGVEFSNGAIVYNNDPAGPSPIQQVGREITGLSLITTMYGAKDTRIRLGRITKKDDEMVIVDDCMVAFTPLLYTIIDPRFEGIPHTPQDGAQEEASEVLDSMREQFNQNTQEAPDEGSPGAEDEVEEEVTPEP